MSLSLTRTIDHLKSLMTSMKDVVFPIYSDVPEADAMAGIRKHLSGVTSPETA